MKTKTKSYGERSDQVLKTWIALVRSFGSIRAQETKYVQGFDLTFGQFQVLEVLYHRGDLTVGELTVLIGSTPGNVTVVLKNLQKQGYISSERSKTDGRSIIKSITPKGRALIGEMFPRHAENLCESFEALSDEELSFLFRTLRKLQKHHRQMTKE